MEYSSDEKTFVILQVKIKPVGLPVDALFRPRLNRKLDQLAQLPVVLVRSAAGYGKSCTVSLWAARVKHRCAWVSLDKEDSKINRFWAYFVSACGVAGYEIDDLFEYALKIDSVSSARDFIHQIVERFRTRSEELSIILEDYHNLEEGSLIHQSLSYFISQAPQNIHLIITSRVFPRIGLTALRDQGVLGEITEEDLSFTKNEVRDLFILSDQTLTAKEVNFIHEYTKGWPVAVKLASLVYSQTHSIEEVFPNFEVDLIIQDYLYDEVFSELPEDIRRFLAITTCVSSFTISLAQALTQKSITEIIHALDFLKDRSLFVTESTNADGEVWYGYHRLFADAASSHLLDRGEDAQPNIMARASIWYEEHGMINEAIDAAARFSDYERIKELIERNWVSAHEADSFGVLMHWFNYLPEDFIESYPQLSIIESLALAATGQTDLALKRMKVAEDALTGEKNEFYGLVMAIKCIVTTLVFGDDSSLEPAEKGIKYLSPEYEYLKGACYQTLGGGKAITAPEEAIVIMEKAFDLPLMQRNPNLTIMGRSTMGSIYTMLGEFEKAKEWIDVTMSSFPISEHVFHPLLVYTYASKAFVCYKQADFKNARVCVDYTLLHALDSWNPFYIARSYAIKAHLDFFEGDKEASRIALTQSTEISCEGFAFEFPSMVALQYWQDQGLLFEGQFTATSYSDTYDAVMWVISALRFVGEEEVDVGQLEEILDSLPRERILNQMEWHILIASVYERQGNGEAAEENLFSAITLSVGVGTSSQIFVENAPYITSILARLVKKERLSYVHILQELTSASMRKQHADKGDLADLTLREKEVAELLVAGLSTKEIAERLFVSTATVKKHLSNIYMKLGVNGRVAATKKLQDKDLLSDL